MNREDGGTRKERAIGWQGCREKLKVKKKRSGERGGRGERDGREREGWGRQSFQVKRGGHIDQEWVALMPEYGWLNRLKYTD